jgi:hypothetical protein
MKTKMLHVLAVIVVGLAFIVSPALAAEQKKPNILVIWGDTSACGMSALTPTA